MHTMHPWARWVAALSLGLGAALAVAPVAQAQDIVLGQIGPFTGLAVPDAPQVNQGIKAYLAQANKAGGVQGRRISLFELDDGYKPEGLEARFAEAMQRKPVALLSPIGSASVKHMLDAKLLDKYDVVVVNAVPGSEALRTPGHPRLFHVRAGDRQQLEKIVHHARTLGIVKIGVLHQNIPIGTSGMKVVAEAAARLGGMDVQGFQATTDAAELAKGAAAMLQLNPQGVLVIGAPPFTAPGVAALRQAGVTQPIFVLADTAPALLVKVAGAEAARGVGIAQIYPNPNGKTKTLVRDFQAAMKAAYPDLKTYAPFQMEGYLSARVTVEALRRIKGEITPAALARSLQTLGEVDYDGLRLDFSRSNAGGHYVDIAVVDQEGRLRY